MDAALLLRLTEAGLFCEAGGFFVDPWLPVDRAIISHAHSDHARTGSSRYLTTNDGETVLRTRLGPDATIDTVAYGQTLDLNGVHISLHPAGHILGSAQIRLEHRGLVCVVSGDYKLEPDTTCASFEPLKCHRFVTESTFGLPIYRWAPQSDTFASVNDWWRASRDVGKACLLFGYALGKAQRLLAGLDHEIGPIVCHGAVERFNQAYREAGVRLPPTSYSGSFQRGTDWAGAMILAPPSAQGSPWVRRFGAATTGFASGWMQIRGTRRRKAVDRGFVLSDHADWPGLLAAVEATGADHVYVTHGYSAVLARWLKERGIEATVVPTLFEGERDEPASAEDEALAATTEGSKSEAREPPPLE
jgi:putative mRNA 3-end processing factor